MKSNRIAIIADWLIDFGGAELVISHLLEMFPEADIYTSVCYMEHPMLKGRKVYTSWIQKIPFFNRHHKLAGILRPFAFRSFDFSGYDLVICSSSAESKQVAMGKWNTSLQPSPKGERVLKPPFSEGEGAGGGGKIIVYCHTPIRYYWSHYEEYRNMMEFGWLNPIARFTFDRLISWLRRLDYDAAQKVDYFIANSRNTAERIKKYYDRESELIYPGVPHPNPLLKERESGTNSPSLKEKGLGDEVYYLGIGRCIPYKKFDLLVDAFNQNGRKLILCTATDTPLFRELKAKSGPNIEWKFRVSNDEKNKLMMNAKAFLFPPEEDFGLVPIEAMAMGTPVIAYGKGGALETILDGETGLFFTPQTPEALNEAIERFEKIKWDKEKIREHTEKFSKERFQEKILKYINDKYLKKVEIFPTL